MLAVIMKVSNIISSIIVMCPLASYSISVPQFPHLSNGRILIVPVLWDVINCCKGLRTVSSVANNMRMLVVVVVTVIIHCSTATTRPIGLKKTAFAVCKSQ